ncbi:MAG TPA: ATP-dependent protease subunit HslV [Nitrospinota bacterium]|jgi:ATP-dependent HslUV protease subunit HslV|nr:ATP-dependent protease subunit HslV [Nitrospinota bacterium]
MFKGTTILLVRRNEKVVIAGDGQVSFGNTVMKHKARKVRKMYKEKIIAGFAGSVADAFALFAKFEEKLEKFQGNLSRSAVELAKEWRTDKILRRLEALMAIADKEKSFILSGTGEVIEPDDGIIGIGSGGPYAIAAAKALLNNTDMEPGEIAEKAMKIAASVCVYTNDNLTFEEL